MIFNNFIYFSQKNKFNLLKLWYVGGTVMLMIQLVGVPSVWYDVLVSFIVFIIPLLFGGFAARRLNFIHGAIVAMVWYCLIGAVYLVTIAHNDVSWMQTLQEYMDRWFSFAAYVPVFFVQRVVFAAPFQEVEFIANNSEVLCYISCFVIPIIVWIISRLISGSIRYRRGY